MLAELAGAGLVRLVRGPLLFQVVFAFLVFSTIAAAAFLLGRYHARRENERNRDQP